MQLAEINAPFIEMRCIDWRRLCHGHVHDKAIRAEIGAAAESVAGDAQRAVLAVTALT